MTCGENLFFFLLKEVLLRSKDQTFIFENEKVLGHDVQIEDYSLLFLKTFVLTSSIMMDFFYLVSE